MSPVVHDPSMAVASWLILPWLVQVTLVPAVTLARIGATACSSIVLRTNSRPVSLISGLNWTWSAETTRPLIWVSVFGGVGAGSGWTVPPSLNAHSAEAAGIATYWVPATS